LPPQCGHVPRRSSVITHFNAGVWSENLQNNRRRRDERTGSTVRAATICGKRFEKLLPFALLVASAAHHFW
jgi:hypothetical protein